MEVGEEGDYIPIADKVTRPCPQTTTFEEKGEPKRYRTKVLPLTSPYRLTARPGRLSSLSVSEM